MQTQLYLFQFSLNCREHLIECAPHSGRTFSNYMWLLCYSFTSCKSTLYFTWKWHLHFEAPISHLWWLYISYEWISSWDTSRWPQLIIRSSSNPGQGHIWVKCTFLKIPNKPAILYLNFMKFDMRVHHWMIKDIYPGIFLFLPNMVIRLYDNFKCPMSYISAIMPCIVIKFTERIHNM